MLVVKRYFIDNYISLLFTICSCSVFKLEIFPHPYEFLHFLFLLYFVEKEAICLASSLLYIIARM